MSQFPKISVKTQLNKIRSRHPTSCKTLIGTPIDMVMRDPVDDEADFQGFSGRLFLVKLRSFHGTFLLEQKQRQGFPKCFIELITLLQKRVYVSVNEELVWDPLL